MAWVNFTDYLGADDYDIGADGLTEIYDAVIERAKAIGDPGTGNTSFGNSWPGGLIVDTDFISEITSSPVRRLEGSSIRYTAGDGTRVTTTSITLFLTWCSAYYSINDTSSNRWSTLSTIHTDLREQAATDLGYTNVGNVFGTQIIDSKQGWNIIRRMIQLLRWVRIPISKVHGDDKRSDGSDTTWASAKSSFLAAAETSAGVNTNASIEATATISGGTITFYQIISQKNKYNLTVPALAIFTTGWGLHGFRNAVFPTNDDDSFTPDSLLLSIGGTAGECSLPSAGVHKFTVAALTSSGSVSCSEVYEAHTDTTALEDYEPGLDPRRVIGNLATNSPSTNPADFALPTFTHPFEAIV